MFDHVFACPLLPFKYRQGLFQACGKHIALTVYQAASTPVCNRHALGQDNFHGFRKTSAYHCRVNPRQFLKSGLRRINIGAEHITPDMLSCNGLQFFAGSIFQLTLNGNLFHREIFGIVKPSYARTYQQKGHQQQ